MKDTLEFTAAFIIATKVYRDVLMPMVHASGTRRNTTAKANSSDNKTLENQSRPKWTDIKQASPSLLWFLVLDENQILGSVLKD